MKDEGWFFMLGLFVGAFICCATFMIVDKNNPYVYEEELVKQNHGRYDSETGEFQLRKCNATTK